MTEVGDHHVIFYVVLDVGPSVCYRRKSPSSEYGSVGPVNMKEVLISDERITHYLHNKGYLLL